MSRVTTTTIAPSYICPTAANAIIAEIGPYQVAADALQAINQFLDEFLGLLLSSSLSLDLSRIKTVVFTLLPSTLGKNAIVEAELEVKTFTETEVINYEVYEHMRNLGTNGTPFPIHEALPALRERCVEFCTLAIEKPSPQEEENHSSINPGSVIIVPIVAIYVTTVLEHVAEYVLTAIAMTAEHEDTEMIRIKEVFLALIDDVQVGGVFYRMVLREKLEKRAYTYGYMPRVMTPMSFSVPKHCSSTAGSINTGFLDISFDDLEIDREDSDYYALRPASLMSSSVSSTTFTSSSAVGLNKKKTHKVLRKEDEEPLFVSNNSTLAGVYDPDASTTMNFEDMIRSGDTVKVTLTPNRLRSIEVKNQMTDQDPPAPTWERRSAASLASRSSRSALRSPSPTPSTVMPPPPPTPSRELPTRPSMSSSTSITSTTTPLPSPPTASRSSPFVAPKKPVPTTPALPTPPGPSPSVSTPSVTLTPSVSTPSISLTPAPTPVITTPQPPSPPHGPVTSTASCELDHKEDSIKKEKDEMKQQQSRDHDAKPISSPPSSPIITPSEISISSDSCSESTITTPQADSSNNGNSSSSDDEKSTTTTTSKPLSHRDSVTSLSSTRLPSPRDSVTSLSSTSTSSSGFMSAVTAQEEQSGESDNNTSTVVTTPIPRQPPIRQRKVSRGSKAWESIEEHAITPAAAARRRLVRQSRESITTTSDNNMEQQQQQPAHNPPKATPQPRPLSSVLDKVMHFERSMDEFAAQQHHRQHRASAYYPRRERYLYLQREPGNTMEAPPRRPLRRRPVTAAVDVSIQTTINEDDHVDDATRQLESAVVGWLLGEA
ncbi:hypothetical protein K492DRAFT_210089 [Lichtheimia hyalospora FSU 10163]|nr:hypothetical protein K492DRAFT_210089 [Lichtheimia hyalospora FSU 10163]